MAPGSRRPPRFFKIAISVSCAASGPSCSAIGPHTRPTYGASMSIRSATAIWYPCCAARTSAESIFGGPDIAAIVTRTQSPAPEQLARRLGHHRRFLVGEELPGPRNGPHLQVVGMAIGAGQQSRRQHPVLGA